MSDHDKATGSAAGAFNRPEPAPAHCTDGPFAPLTREEMDQMAENRNSAEAGKAAPSGPGTFFLGGKL